MNIAKDLLDNDINPGDLVGYATIQYRSPRLSLGVAVGVTPTGEVAVVILPTTYQGELDPDETRFSNGRATASNRRLKLNPEDFYHKEHFQQIFETVREYALMTKVEKHKLRNIKKQKNLAEAKQREVRIKMESRLDKLFV